MGQVDVTVQDRQEYTGAGVPSCAEAVHLCMGLNFVQAGSFGCVCRLLWRLKDVRPSLAIGGLVNMAALVASQLLCDATSSRCTPAAMQ